MVVPKLACLECLLLPPGEVGLMGEGCEVEEREVLMRVKGSLAAIGRPSATPFGNGGGALSVGDLGCE